MHFAVPLQLLPEVLHRHQFVEDFLKQAAEDPAMIRRNSESVLPGLLNLAYCPGLPAFEVDERESAARLRN